MSIRERLRGRTELSRGIERRVEVKEVEETRPRYEPGAVSNVVSFLGRVVGYDTLLLFGDTGTGKTSFCIASAEEFLMSGLSVLYIDTERNVPEEYIDKLTSLGMEYKYTPELTEIRDIVWGLDEREEAKRPKLVIIDAVGSPVLASLAEASMYERGKMMQLQSAIVARLKKYTYRNKAVVICTTQPESPIVINQRREYYLNLKRKGIIKVIPPPEFLQGPSGGKSLFYFKEIWRTFKDYTDVDKGATYCTVRAWRSRRFTQGTEVARIVVSSDGIRLEVASA